MDLLVVCGLGTLLNVICYTTYSAPRLDREARMNDMQVRLWHQYDVNGLSEDDRKLLCLARGQSIELVSWLSNTYTTGKPDMPVQKLFATILLNMCTMICDYKWHADKTKIPSAPDFTIGRLKIQIHAVLSLVMERMDSSLQSDKDLSWNPKSWKFPMPHSCKRILPHVSGLNIQRSPALSYERKSQRELFETGETIRDRMFAGRLESKREIIGLS